LTETNTDTTDDRVDEEQVRALCEERCLDPGDAEYMLRKGMSVESWRDAWPERAAVASRASELRAMQPWMDAALARRLSHPRVSEEDATGQLDLEARQSCGLPAKLVTQWLLGEANPQELVAAQPAWSIVAARLTTIRQTHADLDAFEALRVAWADGRVDWPAGADRAAVETMTRAARDRWPVLNKQDGRTLARFDLTLDELARLRPGRCGHLPRAYELLQAFPKLHRKLARLLAMRDATDDEVAATLR